MSAELPNYACDPEMWRDAEEESGDSDEDFDRMYDEWMDGLWERVADEEEE